MAKQSVLTPQAEDFPRWYQDVISKAELADNGPVRGTMVIRPYAYAIWEIIQSEVDRRIKAAGAENAYFPLFIPEEFLNREADHVEGFSPELAVVTHGGGKKLEEPIVVRPTSEMIINHFFAKWVQSHRDLPLLINQWANVVRWELRPRLFLRTTEFLWQEGHTAHATENDAHEYALRILNDVYLDVLQNLLAMPVIVGRKTDEERFAGATSTWTCEGMMRDGKALQMCTSHELGQNFAKAFDTTYLSDAGEREHVWQTSWGFTTRSIGGLIMTHGDDNGLCLPPAVAPTQVVVMVVRDDADTKQRASALTDELREAGHRVKLDDRTDTSFGRRAVDWELKGVPLRIDMGPRELAEGLVTVMRRDNGEKTSVGVDKIDTFVGETLPLIQSDLLADATARRESAIANVNSVEAAQEAGAEGFARVRWDVIKGEGVKRLAGSAMSVRCLTREDGTLPASEDEPNLLAYVAKAY
jgi:prolyl-tRNA synthetase